MIVNCKCCNKDLNRKPSDISRCKEVFCSRECVSDYKSANILCGCCGIEFRVPKHKIELLNKGVFQNLFCSKRCLQDWQKDVFTILPINKICACCKIDYETKNNKQKYCSYECAHMGKEVVVDLCCDYCGEMFTKKPSMVKPTNFCTKKCSEDFSSKINLELKVRKECIMCNKIYYLKNSYAIKNSCCSKKCSNRWKSEIYPNTESGKAHLLNCGLTSMMNAKLKDTKPERIVREFLIHKNIHHLAQEKMYDKFIVDFYLPDNKYVIEVLGDYWHGNPIKYGETENLKPLTDRQKKQKSKDRARYAYLTTCGHKVLMIWEKDIYDDVENALKELFI